MARIRSLKPEFWADEDLADLPRDARLLYMGLWNLADEHARLRGDARYVKGQLLPYDDDLDPTAVDSLLWLLAKAGKVQRYEAEGRSYLYLPTLSRHQRLEPDKVESKLPPAPVVAPELSQPEPRAGKSAPDSDESEPDAEDHALLYGSGNMEHGTGSMVVARKSARTYSRTDAEFDLFWQAYPRREAKAQARKAWDKATLAVDPDRILHGAERYRDDPNRDQQFTKHPSTWLNGACWDDEALPARSNGMRDHNGLRLNDRTMENVEREKRLAAIEADQRAIGSGAP